MNLAEKLKESRKKSGFTQAELAEKLCVSRQAVTKWESGKGIPDVENLRMISQILNVSIDFLLDEEGVMDQSLIREEIDWSQYPKGNLKKSKQDYVVCEKYPSAIIFSLRTEKKLNKCQKILDEIIGFLTDAPFGTVDMGVQMEHLFNKTFYLVEQDDKQIFVTVTEDFIESRTLSKRVEGKKFEIGEYRFEKIPRKDLI